MASNLRARAAVVATGILLASPASAENPEPGSAPDKPPPAAPAPPQAPPPPPKGKKAAPAPRPAQKRAPPRGRRGKNEASPEGVPVASFPGFTRLEDGKSRIWLEVSAKVDVAENKAQGRVVYRMRGTAVVQRTNQLPLLTGFFATPVDRVQLVQQGPDLDLVIDLRENVEFTHRVIETPRGIVLWVDFPRSSQPERETPAEPQRPRIKRSTESRRIGDGESSDDN
jgi:hypothetical protein